MPTDDDGNSDPNEVQSVYDPASCTRADLTADLSDPAYYWSFDSGLDPDTGTAQMTANGDAAVDTGSLLLDGDNDYLVADGVDKPEDYTFSFFVSPSSRAESGQRMIVNLGNGPGSWEGTGVNVRQGRGSRPTSRPASSPGPSKNNVDPAAAEPSARRPVTLF